MQKNPGYKWWWVETVPVTQWWALHKGMLLGHIFMVYKNLFMTLENLTLDTFRYCLCSLHNDMWGSYERCSRQNHGEGGEGKQAKSVQHLNFFNVIHSHPLNSSMSLFYFVPPWLQISTLTLFLLPQHQLCRRRHLNTITQFDPCFPLMTDVPYKLTNISTLFCQQWPRSHSVFLSTPSPAPRPGRRFLWPRLHLNKISFKA